MRYCKSTDYKIIIKHEIMNQIVPTGLADPDVTTLRPEPPDFITEIVNRLTDHVIDGDVLQCPVPCMLQEKT